MVNELRISVAMVTYNGMAYLKEQMESILNQLSPEDEVVVSDDGSTDGTIEYLKAIQKLDARIRFVPGPGQGIKQNVAHCLSFCKGQLVFLADQDDIWVPDKVERIIKKFKETDAFLVIHDADVFEEDSSKPFMSSFFAYKKAAPGVVHNIVRNSYIGCCMAFRRELLEYILPIPQTIEMHDQWIGVVSDYYFGKSCFIWEPYLHYRRHGGNQSAMKPYGKCRQLRNRIVFLWCFLRRIIEKPRKR